MTYNILTLPDVHWGCIDPINQVKYMEYVFEFIKQSSLNDIGIDLLVIAGDYFDSKLPLNSKEAILAIHWFNELYETCLRYGVKRIRMFQGTLDHDNDQLDVFTPLQNNHSDDSEYFKIFMNTTFEETLPGLKCLYCPDETIETELYEEKYLNEILTVRDIGFFHGSFDVVFGELLERKPELLKKKNVIFHYDLFNKTTLGPLISGHWHDGKIYDHLIYCGSPFRYKFNENEIKGLSFIQYNTDNKSYLYKRIKNPLCPEYVTVEIYSNMLRTQENCNDVITNINNIVTEMKNNNIVENKLKIIIYIVDDKSENDVFISSIRQRFIGDKFVKLNIKNKLKDKIKKEQQQKTEERNIKYDFIYDKNKTPSEVIHDFVKATNDGYEIPIEYINKKVSQYIS